MIKAIKIKLYYASFSLLITELFFLIRAAIELIFNQIFNPIAELVTPIEIPIEEVKTEIKIHPVIVESKIRKFSI